MREQQLKAQSISFDRHLSLTGCLLLETIGQVSELCPYDADLLHRTKVHLASRGSRPKDVDL